MSRRIVIFLALLAIGTGCQPEPTISTQTLERREPKQPVYDVEAQKRMLDHTLVAILPQGEVAWFFKASGPASKIEPVKEAFVAFMQDVDASQKSGQPPEWQLPDGWQEAGPSRMRAATLTMPEELGSVEIAVSSLPKTGDWQSFLSRNVTRWMGQLGGGPLSRETIGKLAREVNTKAGTATVLHLAGFAPKKPGTDPHAGMALGRSGTKSETKSPTESKTDAPPATSGGPPANDSFQYETPAGWQPGRMSSMRRAAFNLTEGEYGGEVTVISFPSSAGKQITDVEANVRRWAGQVGLTPQGEDGLSELVRPTSIGGADGHFAKLMAPEQAERSVGLLVAMVEFQDEVWFFKLIGDSPLVEAQEAKFREFLDSVRFN